MTKRNALPALVMLFPALVFYALLSRETVNLPFLDDYTGVLGFLNAWKGIATVRGKLLDILLTQHNEYKLIFAQAVFAIQYLASGKVDFAVLSALGNGLVVPIFLVLGAMWRADRREIENRLLLFVPVAWVLFQFQYYSLLNWPVASLQQLAALLFSLLAIHLLCGEGRASFWWAIASMGLAIGASGNGLFLAPIGGLMLLQFRRTRRLLGWAAAAAAMVAGYFYGYDTRQSQAHADHSVVSSLHHLSPLYALSFLGASIARYDDYLPSALLGGAVVLTFLWAARVRLYARSPALFYSMLFALATAAAVSGLRSDLGVSQSLVSRYRIYSNLSVILSYLFVAGELRPQSWRPRARMMAAGAVMAAAVGFNLASTYAGFRLLRVRTDLTLEGVRRWELGEPSITVAAGPPHEDPVIKRQRLNGNFAPVDEDLRRSIELGIYELPKR